MLVDGVEFSRLMIIGLILCLFLLIIFFMLCVVNFGLKKTILVWSPILFGIGLSFVLSLLFGD